MPGPATSSRWIRSATRARATACSRSRTRSCTTRSGTSIRPPGLIFTSAALARREGVPESQWIHPRAVVESNYMLPLVHRAELHRCAAFRIAGRRAAELASLRLAQLAHLELYSCFPVAVRVQQRELGIPRQQPVTVTGGMAFAGGPLNNFVLQAAVRLAQRLREEPGAAGMLNAVSGMLTQAGRVALVVAARPRVRGRRRERGGGARDAARARSPSDFSGTRARRGLHGALRRATGPRQTIVLCDTGDGARAVAVGADPALADAARSTPRDHRRRGRIAIRRGASGTLSADGEARGSEPGGGRDRGGAGAARVRAHPERHPRLRAARSRGRRARRGGRGAAPSCARCCARCATRSREPLDDAARRAAVERALAQLRAVRATPDYAARALAQSPRVLAGLGPRRAEQLAKRGIRTRRGSALPPARRLRRPPLARDASARSQVGARVTFAARVLGSGFAGWRGRGGRGGRMFEAVRRRRDRHGRAQVVPRRRGDRAHRAQGRAPARDRRRQALPLRQGDPAPRGRGARGAGRRRGASELPKRIVPRYATPEGVHPRALRRAVAQAVAEYADLVTGRAARRRSSRERRLPSPARGAARAARARRSTPTSTRSRPRRRPRTSG